MHPNKTWLFHAILLIAIAGVGLTSCKEKETKCDNYFLISETLGGTTSKVIYNTSGKISSITSTGGFGTLTTTYTYLPDQQLKAVAYDNVVDNFKFNGDGKLLTAYRSIDGQRRDSITFVYDSQGRVIKQNWYNRGQIPPMLYRMKDYQYINANEFVAKISENSFDNPGQFKVTSIWRYKTDNNPLPYPAEYYFHYAAFGNTVLTHNVLSYEVTDVPHPSSTEYSITYNVGGYPTRVEWTGSIQRYLYSCTPPQQ